MLQGKERRRVGVGTPYVLPAHRYLEQKNSVNKTVTMSRTGQKEEEKSTLQHCEQL
jgi:hypothetical protein